MNPLTHARRLWNRCAARERLAQPFRAALLCFSLAVTPAAADSLQIHLASDHSDEGDHVERNWGIGYTERLSPWWSAHASVLRNSQGEPAAFGCALAGGRIAAGPCLGLGYENSSDSVGEILPFGVITVRLLPTRVSPRLNIVPLGGGEYVYEVSLDFRLD